MKLTAIVQSTEAPAAMLTLSFDQRQRSRLRVTLDDGREAALLLERGAVLRGGCCLRSDDGVIVRVIAAPEPVSTVPCPDPYLLARACYHLGNRHIPLQIGTGWVRYQQDHVLDDLVHGLGLRPVAESAPFEPEAGAYGHHAPETGGGTEPSLAPEGRVRPEEHAALHESAHAFGPALLALLRLTSSSLPVGSFAYSQGMEYAVEHGWISDEASARAWIAGLLRHSQALQDMPLLLRLCRAWESDDAAEVQRWNARLLAARESRELRAEELNVGTALARLLADLGVARAGMTPSEQVPKTTDGMPPLGYLAMFALACVEWKIPPRDAVCGYLWSWCQNQVTAAIKLVPLGQTAGQRILQTLIESIPAVADQAFALEDEDIGFTAPGLALASARHEGQYTRLFLS
ncbi:MAG: urease accessory protein UreE [Gammaproteobacteria bacterium]|nr:urease accessory protein UreE [Gammaproteobacteria bacterium]